ncbi:glutamine--fructose-6-phosphate transaminase (isomerizing) [Christensenella minuta]|uniref:glutamine--fructose-6-phosphate transaminase (isomerizing) n=1 Tax=Christensenella minuta TaxID=626937 RepID=UPI002A822D3A|nr:glutamine--fructose-6-phosphate transaminase (isomerizing) [Christensenella minuta]MDY3750581.1 glutamine--fructose-6-phosphate transaminase (isomerizing) [Christensenella minuta]
MCGIVGYIGDRNVIPVLIGGLQKLEYRGYDSAGIAYLDDGRMTLYKEKGKLAGLEKMVAGKCAEHTVGIGHTRWATHGEPNQKNAHPHINEAGDLAIVHNGIIENYLQLREWLTRKGVSFVSETDTEIIAHLIAYYLKDDLKEAVSQAISKLKGSYALGVICERFPDEIVAVRKDSPLVVGVGKNENLIASDIPAILEYTRDVYFLNNGEIAVVKKDEVMLYDEVLNPVNRDMFTVEWDVSQAEKAGYPHFMLKEIEEQPRALADTLNPRVKDGEINFDEIGIDDAMLAGIRKITIIACGTAYHASYVGKYIIERFARVPVEVEIASEFRYKNPIIDQDNFVIVVSQSGETADTIAALREAKSRGAFVLAIANVVGSTIAREADKVLYTRAGLEIAVASTKAYTTQLMALYMFALKLAYAKGGITKEEYHTYVAELQKVPENAEKVIQNKELLQKFAYEHFTEHSVFYIGRGLDYAMAMEGSLKLKEISYIHSEAYAGGELKHGTIALVEEGTLVVAVLTQGDLIEKCLSNVKEVTSRGAVVMVVTQEKYQDLVKDVADKIVTVPDAIDFEATITSIIPMQIFAYYMSVQKGCDVDKPRNLAKSVTVE